MARIIHYEDIALAVEPEPGGGYRVRALSSPYGPAAAPFRLLSQRPRLEALIRMAAAGVRRNLGENGAATTRDLGGSEMPGVSERDLRQAGGLLFRSLFDGAVRENYLLSRGRVEARADRGLRIRIALPENGTDAALLQALPWELLYCEETRDFLARNPLTPVIRILPLSWAAAPLPESAPAPIRSLIVVANPRGTVALGEDDESARILESLDRQPRAEVDLLRNATLRELSATLASKQYQVIHYIGHGGFDAAAGAGFVLLGNARGEADRVPGEVLATALRASRALRLVFLNSCQGAEFGRHPNQDPLLAAAAALVRGGVPAVLAMQFPITDAAARIFSAAVYLSLARGSSIEAAVGDGRVALYQASPRSWEWITPALFAADSGPDVFRPLCPAAEDRVGKSEEAVLQVSRLLKSGSHAAARQVVEARLDQGEELADLHYYMALALLDGRRPRFLKIGEIKPIEASARRAIDRADRAAHHFCLLAFLVRDFYLDNHLAPRPPSYEELMKLAVAAPMDRARLAELAQLVPWAEPMTALAAERTGSDAQ
jgi:hypothetical protein